MGVDGRKDDLVRLLKEKIAEGHTFRGAVRCGNYDLLVFVRKGRPKIDVR